MYEKDNDSSSSASSSSESNDDSSSSASSSSEEADESSSSEEANEEGTGDKAGPATNRRGKPKIHMSCNRLRNQNSTTTASSNGDSDEDSRTVSLDASSTMSLNEDFPQYMHQPPPLKDQLVSIGDEDNKHDCQYFKVFLSTLSVLLLQWDPRPGSFGEDGEFPNILSLPVNNRGGIEYEKLNSQSEQSNIFLRFILNRNKDTSPVNGYIHVVFFCFDYDPDGEFNSDQLKSLCTVGSNQPEGKFNVREMTNEDCARILRWLHPESTFDSGSGGDLVEGKRIILEHLGKLPVYGSFDQMEALFREKVWDKPGAKESVEQAEEIIKQRHDSGENCSRLSLRRILLKMISYQIQMACAPVDGIHRLASVLCASVGACPPQMDPQLMTLAQTFTNNLKNTEGDGWGMGIESTGESDATVDINTQLVLVAWQPRGEAFDSAFFEAMTDKSRELQEIDSSGDKHTAKNVIEKIMSQFVARFDELPAGCLFHDSEDCSMARAFAARQVCSNPSPDQRRAQVEGFLRGTAIPEDIVDAYLNSIEENPRKIGKCYTNYFSSIYTQLWVETLARHMKAVLSDFCKNNQKMLEAWENNQLSKLVEKNDEEWLDIFKSRTSKKLGDATLNYCGCKEMTYLSTLLDKNKDPLKPSYCRKQDETQGSTMRSHEFLWTIVWAHLRRDILGTYHDVFSGAMLSSPEYPQKQACQTSHVERMLTCIVQVVTCAVKCSTVIWQDGLGMDCAGRLTTPSWKHAAPALEALLFLVAVQDAIKFVKRLGFHPEYHQYLRCNNNPRISDLDRQVGGSSRVTDALGTDLVLFHVIAFVAQMKHLTAACESLQQDTSQGRDRTARRQSNRSSAMKEILKCSVEDKFPDDEKFPRDGLEIHEELARFMEKNTNGFDMREVVHLIKFRSSSQLKLNYGVDSCTHSISEFIRVKVGDWNKTDPEEVDMGIFCEIDYITQLLSEATQTNSARSEERRNEASQANSARSEEQRNAGSSRQNENRSKGQDENASAAPSESAEASTENLTANDSDLVAPQGGDDTILSTTPVKTSEWGTPDCEYKMSGKKGVYLMTEYLYAIQAMNGDYLMMQELDERSEEYRADSKDSRFGIAMHVPNTGEFVMSKWKDFEDDDCNHLYIPVTSESHVVFRKAVKKKRKRSLDQSTTHPKKKKKMTIKERAEVLESWIGKASEDLKPITSLDDESEDIEKFKGELKSLPGHTLVFMFDVLRRLKNPESGKGEENDDDEEEQDDGNSNANAAADGCGADGSGNHKQDGNDGGQNYKEHADSSKVSSSFVEEEAECRGGSGDENVDDKEYDNPQERDFIDNTEQENNNPGSHRRCDNEGRGGDDGSVNESCSGSISIGSLDLGEFLEQAEADVTEQGVVKRVIGFGFPPNGDWGF